MPSLNALTLPQPKNWQEFEDIVLASCKLAWSSPTLTKNGRAGQKQAGVDIYGPDQLGRRTGVQCKRYKTLSLEVVRDEIKNAGEFAGQLSTLFIATTADHDAKLQQEVRILSDAQVSVGGFAVGLLFWEDVVSGLFLNPAILKTFYPQISVPQVDSVDRTRLLAAVELGFYGPYLWQYVLLTFGEIGQMVNTDADTVEAVLRIVEARASQLLNPVDMQPVLDSVVEIRRGCYNSDRDQAVWDQVEAHAGRIATRLHGASSLLPLTEGGMLNLAISLGRADHDFDEPPSRAYMANVKQVLSSVLPADSMKSLAPQLRAAAKQRWGYQWANTIRAGIEREIRYAPW